VQFDRTIKLLVQKLGINVIILEAHIYNSKEIVFRNIVNNNMPALLLTVGNLVYNQEKFLLVKSKYVK